MEQYLNKGMKEEDILKTEYAKDFVKNKIIHWLENNGVDLKGKKMRLINYQSVPELRVYTHTLEYVSSRTSFRENKAERETTDKGFIKHGMSGRFNIKKMMYNHINLEDIKNAEKDPEEKEFLLMQFKE